MYGGGVAIDYKPISELARRALVEAGLSAHQSAIYEALIQRGPQKATRLAFLAGVPRTLSYKVLDELVAAGLVTKKDEPGRVSQFVPVHPIELKKMAQRRLDEAASAKQLVDQALPELVRGYDEYIGALPESELYARVALYAGRAGLGTQSNMSASEKFELQKALKDLLAQLTK